MTSPSEATEADRVRDIAREVIARMDPRSTPRAEFLGAWFDAGLSWVHFPRGFGGLGVSPRLQRVVESELLDAGGSLPRLANKIGYGFVAATLVEHAPAELTQRLLRPLATADHIWCQLFSEPGAGSDLAGLATSARREGDHWIINGQKVWSSQAHRADWGILLARTDPNVPKNNGITFFVVDMRSAGVDVRPLRQMTGQAEFNEVFLTDVAIPDTQRIGAVGGGWGVARTTLTNERMSVGDRHGGAQAPSAMADALSAWAQRPERRTPVLRDKLVRLWLRAQAHKLSCDRFAAQRAAGSPGQESAIAKLVSGELNQAAYEFCVDLMGLEAGRYGSFSRTAPEDAADDAHLIQQRFLRSRANTIEGGTAEVLRNIISERLLGLPEEHRVDRGVPWREVRRG